MEGFVTWQTIVNEVVFLLTVGGAIAAVWFRVEGRVAAAEKKAASADEELSRGLDAAQKEISEHRIYSAEKYIKQEAFEKMEARVMASEARMIASIDNLAQRIDRVLSEWVKRHGSGES